MANKTVDKGKEMANKTKGKEIIQEGKAKAEETVTQAKAKSVSGEEKVNGNKAIIEDTSHASVTNKKKEGNEESKKSKVTHVPEKVVHSDETKEQEHQAPKTKD